MTLISVVCKSQSCTTLFNELVKHGQAARAEGPCKKNTSIQEKQLKVDSQKEQMFALIKANFCCHSICNQSQAAHLRHQANKKTYVHIVALLPCSVPIPTQHRQGPYAQAAPTRLAQHRGRTPSLQVLVACTHQWRTSTIFSLVPPKATFSSPWGAHS